MKKKLVDNSAVVYDESYYQNLIEQHKTEYLKRYRTERREASDGAFFDQHFISNTVDVRKRQIEQSETIYPFLQIVTSRLALSRLTRFEILIECCNETKIDIPATANLLAEYDALLLVWTYITAQNYYAINTGTIYSNIYEMWQNDLLISINRNELYNIGLAIQRLLKEKKVTSYVDWGNDPGGLKDYIENRHKREMELVEDENNFPFPPYFILEKKAPHNSYDIIPKAEKISVKQFPEYYTIIHFDQSYNVEVTDSNFDYFFAIQLYTLDIIKDTKKFLEYHLPYTYDNNVNLFNEFLDAILRKYKFLKDLQAPTIQNFIIEKNSVQNNASLLQEVVEPDNRNFTIRRRVLAMNYLLDGLNVSGVDKTDIARFIQFFSGKGSTEIMDNNNIYKLVKQPYPLDDKALVRDLQFIRPFFEQLQLDSIVKKINKEIATKDKNSG